MDFEWWLTFRYLRAKKDKFLSVINFVAVAGKRPNCFESVRCL